MTNQLTLRQQVQSAADQFGLSLPGHITKEKFTRTALTAVSMTRNIDRVKDPKTLLTAISKAAADGLILDGREAALVVDYNGEAQYRPMMRGLLKLAYNSGMLKSLVVETVRENDEFTYEPTNLEHPLTHKINPKAGRGEAYAYYALAVLKDGGIVHEFMTLEDVNAIRDRSDAYRAFKAGKIKSTPWSTDHNEMARKTVFRRLSKYLPSSTDNELRVAQAAERIDEDYTFDEPEPVAIAPPVKRRSAAKALAEAPEPVVNDEGNASEHIEEVKAMMADDVSYIDASEGDAF